MWAGLPLKRTFSEIKLIPASCVGLVAVRRRARYAAGGGGGGFGGLGGGGFGGLGCMGFSGDSRPAAA